MKRELSGNGGNTLLNVIIIVLIVGVVAVLYVPSIHPREAVHKAACQNNMKELGLALAMYEADYNKMLPSSAVNGGKTWDAGKYRVFATKRGMIPPQAGAKPITWAMLLYPYMKNKDIIWCPADPERPNADLGFWRRHFGHKPVINAGSTVSYWYKAAIDRAWFDGKRKEADFAYPSEQIVFYEHAGWHWGDQGKGLSNGVTINCAFVDGHVATRRLTDAGNANGKSVPLAPGEPGWFNCAFKGEGATIKMTFPGGHIAPERITHPGKATGNSKPLVSGMDSSNRDAKPGRPLGVGEYFDARRQGDILP